MMWWLENVKIWHSNQFLDGAVEIDTESGTIVRVSRRASRPGINGNGLWVLPGMIDIHVHLRGFEESYKEDYYSGSMAALHGGVTTVFDMPNKKPLVITLEDLARNQEKIKKESLIDIYSYLLFTKQYTSWGTHRFLKGIYGETFGVETSSISDLHWAAENFSGILVLHLEDPAFFDNNAIAHYEKRPPEAEDEAVRKLINNLPKEKSAHIHIAHLSTKKALARVIAAKCYGITCEAAPHHIFLDINCINSLGNRSIANPPIRSSSDRQAIYQGVINGGIDLVASDHAPHTLEEKENKGLPGVPGLETTLPLLLTDMARGNISIERIIRLFSEFPADLMQLDDRGRIDNGRIADLILVDPKKEWTLKADDLFTKSKWSPFEGYNFVGVVAATLKKGVAAFLDEDSLHGSFLEQVPSNI